MTLVHWPYMSGLLHLAHWAGDWWKKAAAHSGPSFIIIINRSLLVTLLFLWVSAKLFCWALRSPDARPKLNWRRSSSTVLSQACLGRPGRRLQFLGAGDMQACRAREWSWDLWAQATWPKKFRRLIRTVSDSSGWPVRRRTSKFVTHSDQVMFRIRPSLLYQITVHPSMAVYQSPYCCIMIRCSAVLMRPLKG